MWLRRFSKFTCLSTLLLIFAGGMVTSTGSGLAVPDWPNTYGYFMFSFPLSQMVGGIFYEHTHRLIASFVGLLTVILSFWLWRSESRKWVKQMGWSALLAVILQGLLGGLTVLFFLPTAVSMTHGILAQTFFCITICIAYVLSKEWSERKNSIDLPQNKKLFHWSLFAVGLIYLQLILGALMRHTGSGLALMDFPLFAGNLLPILNQETLMTVNSQRFELGLNPVTMSQIVIHVLHRLAAIGVSIGIIGLFVNAVRSFRTNRKIWVLPLVLAILLGLQLTLAAFVIWSVSSPLITTLHVWTGALMLGTSVLLVLRCYRLMVLPQEMSMLSFAEAGIGFNRAKMKLVSFKELTKPNINLLVLVATFIGFYLGLADKGESLVNHGWLLFHTLLGTACVSGGVAALNEFIERKLDGKMNRTKSRPLPSGKLTGKEGLIFGLSISGFGILYLVLTVSFAVGILSLLTLVMYLGIYTPLKTRTVWNTFIGAVPGALPPVGGWLAAQGKLAPEVWILFGILFLWQMPHFFSIAWIYREDYAKAGFKMIPINDESGRFTSIIIVSFSVALILCSLLLVAAGLASKVYLISASIAGLIFLSVAFKTAHKINSQKAKRLLIATILYLPLLLVLLVADVSLFG